MEPRIQNGRMVDRGMPCWPAMKIRSDQNSTPSPNPASVPTMPMLHGALLTDESGDDAVELEIGIDHDRNDRARQEQHRAGPRLWNEQLAIADRDRNVECEAKKNEVGGNEYDPLPKAGQFYEPYAPPRVGLFTV